MKTSFCLSDISLHHSILTTDYQKSTKKIHVTVLYALNITLLIKGFCLQCYTKYMLLLP